MYFVRSDIGTMDDGIRQAVAEMIEASQKTVMDKISTVLSCL